MAETKIQVRQVQAVIVLGDPGDDLSFPTEKAVRDALDVIVGGVTVSASSPQGTLYNGKIVVSVASNNLTVAIKNLAGNNPSAGDPVFIRLGNALYTLTAALSVTKNAGTNWCNSGSAELATKEIDYFVYLGYNATDGVVIGFSRIPFGLIYSDFSVTTTNEKYCAISTIANAAAGDCYENIGRFAATLSAGGGYTWTVPTFTNANLIQKPIYESRWLIWVPTYSASGAMTYTSVVTTRANYKILGNEIFINIYAAGTTGGTASNEIRATTPFLTLYQSVSGGGTRFYYNGAGNWLAAMFFIGSGMISVTKVDTSNLALATDTRLICNHYFEI